MKVKRASKQKGLLQLSDVVASLDREIDALRRARDLLLDNGESAPPVKRGPGRPKKVQPILGESPSRESSSRRRTPNP